MMPGYSPTSPPNTGDTYLKEPSGSWVETMSTTCSARSRTSVRTSETSFRCRMITAEMSSAVIAAAAIMTRAAKLVIC